MVDEYLRRARLRARRPLERGRRRPAPRAWSRRCATRCWPAASGSAGCWRWPRRGARRATRAPAARGRGDRAGAHLLADPRRPAGDGRRRPAPRTADLPPRVRRGRGDPGRRRPLRRGGAAGVRAPGGRRRGAGRDPAPRSAAPPASAGMVGGQFLDLRGAGHASPDALRAGPRPQDRAADGLRGPLRPGAGRPAARDRAGLPRLRRASSACCSRSWTTSSTWRARRRPWARRSARTRARTRRPT